MEVSNNLKKQIIIEIIVLLLMAGVAIYAYIAIGKSGATNVINQDGLVLVLDDSNFSKLERLSDGKGMEQDFVRYTITNNNNVLKNVKLVVIPSIKDEEILSNIRVGINDLYKVDLTKGEKLDDGYVIDEFTLNPGITRNYLLKFWYKLDSNIKNIDNDVTFEYKVILEDE